MLIRIIVAVIALMAMGAPAFAEDPFCKRHVTFKREFFEDIEGGHYWVGEDPEITLRFRETSNAAAELKIIDAHRTKEFGSGVAFLFCDASLKRTLRIGFGDSRKSDKLSLVAQVFEEGKKDSRKLIPSTELAVSKTETNRITFRKDSKGQIVIGISGEVFTFDPGFDIQFLRVQIFCSKSRVRFLDGELIS